MMNILIDSNQLTSDTISSIFAKAKLIKSNSKKKNKKILRGKTIANMFFENSTRTLVSFEIAAKRLGADVININISKSSTTKGESLKDTLLTLQAMKINAFVIRHPENHICEKIQQWLKPQVKLINAGDGNNQHPTQGLLDVYTILQHKKNISDLKIAIIGDIIHSRVANSLIQTLGIMGNKNISLFGPKSLLPLFLDNATVCTSMQQAISNADVVYMLRIQKERMTEKSIPNSDNYHQYYGLNRQSLALANHGCIVMHPGPINREVEISSEIADNSPSVILEQVTNGVLIRQAILAELFG